MELLTRVYWDSKRNTNVLKEIATKDLKVTLVLHEVPQLQICENRPYVLGGKTTCLANQFLSPGTQWATGTG